MIDLVCDNEILATNGPTGNDQVFRFSGLKGETRTYEIWLPVFAYTYVKSIRVVDGATLQPVADERVRWLTYGSSITQCRACLSPDRA
ncbi:hypothetical protein [Cerasicoccus arenae]|uniref:Uncharacterized protein n=1 Tax=Cerasicoccus arenae TaxID=424488 RepID=A0A8J3DCJ9_9BACT|nr:hypothetical protein [Cerasicoccus arenae]MBK1860065.1 hypothetical protein [Cerasicoccus arenae]GHC04589.1 hypothetical protein GCM10007047_21800 [Cerasicoccus arenae]